MRALSFLVDPFKRGIERSEQNNPVSCFANGDRSILRDVTINQIQNVEQNTRTNPLRHYQKLLTTFVMSLFCIS